MSLQTSSAHDIDDKVLGVADDDIAKDYSLTTEGLAPVMPILIERFKKQAVYAENPEGAMAMGTSRRVPTSLEILVWLTRFQPREHDCHDQNDSRKVRQRRGIPQVSY